MNIPSDSMPLVGVHLVKARRSRWPLTHSNESAGERLSVASSKLMLHDRKFWDFG